MATSADGPIDVSTMVDILPKQNKGCCGVNTVHLKALIKKDFTNLKRRKCFFGMFIFLPILISYLASYLFSDAIEIEENTISGSLLQKYYKHHFFGSFPASATLGGIGNTTELIKGTGIRFNAMFQDPGKCSRIFVASEDPDVRESAKLYVQNLMLGNNP